MGMAVGVDGVQASSESLNMNGACLDLPYSCHVHQYSEILRESLDTHFIVSHYELLIDGHKI